MKKIILLFSLFGLIVSCADTKPCDEPTNGFITGTSQTVMLGSEATVEVFKTIDKAWLERDYYTLKAHLSDEGIYRHADGSISNNGDEFIASIEKDYQDTIDKGENGDGLLTLHLLQNQVLQKIQPIQILMENGSVLDLLLRQLFMMNGIKLSMVNWLTGLHQKEK